MTSVERARKFIQARGKAIALTIVPLAALTLVGTQSARALTIPLSFNNDGSCSVTALGQSQQGIFSQTNSCTESVVAGSQNGISNALKMTGNATVVPFAPQGLEGSFVTQTPSMGIQFQMSGTASGSDTGIAPLNWDFNLTDTNSGATSGAYTLTFSFTGTGAPSAKVESNSLVYTSCNGGSAVCASVLGSDAISFNGQVTGYTITLAATVNSQFGNLTLNVPQNSIDVNEQPTGAPEPTSMALGATSLLGLMFARFRRRKV